MEPMERLSSAFTRFATTLAAGIVVLAASFQACANDDSDARVEAILNAVVGLRAIVPETARTAWSLGTQREGSGIVIDDNGMVLTIGYLILEASDVEVTNAEGDFVAAELVAYDYDSGFGLVRAKRSLGLEGISLGTSSELEPGDAALIVAHIGPDYMRPAQVADIREFPGYWEYLLDHAIFTTPPFQGFGGAALINTDGKLVGVGSLIVNDAFRGVQQRPGNMFVPIDLLKPIMEDLVANGRDTTKKRPWLGVYTAMNRGHLFVSRVAIGGPAETGGIRRNDIIVAVNGSSVSDMADFLRQVWATGPAGSDVEISVLRDGAVKNVVVESADRYDWLNLKPPSQFTAMAQID